MNKLEAAIWDMDQLTKFYQFKSDEIPTLTKDLRQSLYDAVLNRAAPVIEPAAFGSLYVERSEISKSMGCLDSGL